jgi:hypothetical protein
VTLYFGKETRIEIVNFQMNTSFHWPLILKDPNKKIRLASSKLTNI